MRTLHYGFGAIGQVAVREARKRSDVEVAGVLDIDPDKVGKDVGELLGEANSGMAIRASSDVEWPAADVVVHAAGSHLSTVKAQLKGALERGYNVVSICEELSYPWLRNAEAAAELDAVAREHGVTLLGTGVNPGFAMDTWVVSHTAIANRVDFIEVVRALDAAKRRLPLQQKVGAGMSTEAFAERARANALGHVGLVESAQAVATSLGWTPFDIARSLEPVIATRLTGSEQIKVQAGDVAGIHEVVEVSHGGRPVLRLDLTMAMGVEDEKDEVRIEGDPPVHVVAEGGFHGDRSTVGILLNSARAAAAAPPGLLTMRDIAPVHWSANGV